MTGGSVLQVPEKVRQPPRRIRGLDAEQRREQRREALLDAALDLFAAQGYAATTIEQLCQHAYVGTKAFYETFDSRDQLYSVLLHRVADTALAEAAEAGVGDDETVVSERIVTTLAHRFADDVRWAKVTFGHGSAITPSAEVQRRTNRRAAAAFVEDVWVRFRGHPTSAQEHAVAIGLIGGLFDIIADWVLDLEGEESTPEEIEELTTRLLTFYRTVRAGLE